MSVEWEFHDNWNPEAEACGEGYGPDDAWVCKTNQRYIVILSSEEEWHLMDTETDELMHSSTRAEECKQLAEILMNTQAASPEELCRRTEIQLVDFVLQVVKQSGEDWWVKCIPQKVRQECVIRREGEGRRFPEEAYFDLIDLKEIMFDNWQLFEPYLQAVGLKGGKKKSLDWIVTLNEIRKLIDSSIEATRRQTLVFCAGHFQSGAVFSPDVRFAAATIEPLE